ncbi:MAG TPA: Uma2 family endonuclease [Chloroflexota bacterium]|jgi:Uma2 family endonuclease|nr:Uma2 family endonuclease [Chloroflexota bacterium]
MAIAAHPAPVVARHRFNVTQYHLMAEAGILTEDDRVELIDGEILDMSPIGAAHGECVDALNELLTQQVRGRARIRVQGSIRVNDASEPEPDIAVLQRRRHRQALPTTAEVYLVIEVADSSRGYDLGTKLPFYAAAGIAEAFLIDVINDVVERHTEPHDGTYQRVMTARRGETLTSTVLPAVVLPVDVVLGYELPD